MADKIVAPPAVADLNDAYGVKADDYGKKVSDVQIMAPILRNYGARVCFGGPALTLRMWDHNGSLMDDITLRILLTQEGGGKGRVLVIDNGGSAANACMGANLAGLASEHGWAGIIVHGYIRDTYEIKDIDIGLHAMGSLPSKPGKSLPFITDVPLAFGDVSIKPGDWVYADWDGILISPRELTLPPKE